MTCYRASLNVALEWYITFLTNQKRKARKRGTVSLKKGPEATVSLSFPLFIPELAICLVGKVHVTKMKLNLNFFALGLQIPQTSYSIF